MLLPRHTTLDRLLLPGFVAATLLAGTMLGWAASTGLVAWSTALVGMVAATLVLLGAGAAHVARKLDALARQHERAEVANREHELRYRLIVDATFDGIVISQNGFIKDANPGYEAMFGYEHADLIGRSVFDLVAEESRAMVVERIRAGLGGAYDVVGVRKDGSKFTFDTVVRVHGEGDQQIRVAALRDSTQQRKLEEQLRQSQKMEAVGSLAGGVAHDFNNLLTVILGYCEILLLDENENDSAALERIDQLKQIRDAGQSAAGLTRQLLAFSRQQVLQPQTLSLNTVVANTEKLLGRLIGEDVHLQSTQRAELRQIKADPGQLEQVLMNLAVNARDAMPQGGTLMIETSNVDLEESVAAVYSEVTPGRYVQLSVTDSGTGMDKETERRIFEPFFTTKGVGKGTGLGLASVYGIVQQSGGHIWVYSEVGHGTAFKIFFPAVDDDDAQSAVTETPGLLRGTETILIAEDSDAVRVLTQNVLRDFGYTVISADTPAAAVAMSAAYAQPIHLLLTDVVMPGMNGSQLAQLLQEQRAGLKVLFMSGYTSDAVLQRGILGPNMTLLQKPFTPPALARTVRAVLDRE